MAKSTDSPSELTVSWLPTSEGNMCRESGYEISLYRLEVDQCQTNNMLDRVASLNVTMGSTSSVISHVKPYSTYNVTIRAYNSAGMSETVSVINITDISGKNYYLFS